MQTTAQLWEDTVSQQINIFSFRKKHINLHIQEIKICEEEINLKFSARPPPYHLKPVLMLCGNSDDSFLIITLSIWCTTRITPLLHRYRLRFNRYPKILAKFRDMLQSHFVLKTYSAWPPECRCFFDCIWNRIGYWIFTCSPVFVYFGLLTCFPGVITVDSHFRVAYVCVWNVDVNF